MFRKRLALAALSVALVSAPVVMAQSASATTYGHNIGSYDIIGEGLGCKHHLQATTHFGVDAQSGSTRGIWVDYVDFTNNGNLTIISANFHNMSPHGQGHRDLPSTTLRPGQTLRWHVNAVFWFTFSSTWQQVTSECGGGWADYTIWRGPTH